VTYRTNIAGEERPKRVGFLGFDGMTTLDLTGPAGSVRDGAL
jgi:hypothetical protein